MVLGKPCEVVCDSSVLPLTDELIINVATENRVHAALQVIIIIRGTTALYKKLNNKQINNDTDNGKTVEAISY